METEFIMNNKGEESLGKKKDKEEDEKVEVYENTNEEEEIFDWKKLNKWNKMVRKLKTYWDSKEKFRRLKIRTREGIPECMRGYIWQVYAQVEDFMKRGDYYQLLNSMKNINEELNSTEKEILKDIDRTLPNSTFFKDKLGLGQRSLFNVLSTFSRHNPETGYVQGMGFFTACLLNYMDEESAYWMLNSIMEKYKINSFFKEGFVELKKANYKLIGLLKKFHFKIYEAFRLKHLNPSSHTNQWFLTLFFINVRYENFVRIFDIFLLEGESKLIYRIGLSLLKLNEEKIVNAKEFDELMEIMKHLDDNITIENLLDEAFELKINKKLLSEYEKQYEQLCTNKSNDDILDLLNM